MTAWEKKKGAELQGNVCRREGSGEDNRAVIICQKSVGDLGAAKYNEKKPHVWFLCLLGTHLCIAPSQEPGIFTCKRMVKRARRARGDKLCARGIP